MQARPTSGDVVALGDGQVGTKQHEFTLKVGGCRGGAACLLSPAAATAPCTNGQARGSAAGAAPALAGAAQAPHHHRLSSPFCLALSLPRRPPPPPHVPHHSLPLAHRPEQGGETILYSKFGIGTTELLLQGQTHILIREDDVIGVMPRSNATAAGTHGRLGAGRGGPLVVPSACLPAFLPACRGHASKGSVSTCSAGSHAQTAPPRPASPRPAPPRPAPPPADVPELKPLGDRVLVRVQESADVTMGGVILPDSAKERPLRCGGLGGAAARRQPARAAGL